MTDTTPDPGDREPCTDERIRAIAAGLTAAGLDAHLHETKGVLDITAIAKRPGAKDTEVTVDEDGYVVVSYWNHPGATPDEVVATIRRALAAICEPS